MVSASRLTQVVGTDISRGFGSFSCPRPLESTALSVEVHSGPAPSSEQQESKCECWQDGSHSSRVDTFLWPKQPGPAHPGPRDHEATLSLSTTVTIAHPYLRGQLVFFTSVVEYYF